VDAVTSGTDGNPREGGAHGDSDKSCRMLQRSNISFSLIERSHVRESGMATERRFTVSPFILQLFAGDSRNGPGSHAGQNDAIDAIRLI